MADAEVADRKWAPGKRAVWWAKFATMVAGAIVGIATACRVLGIDFGFESKAEAAAAHERIKTEVRAEVRESFDLVRSDVREMRAEMRSELAEIRAALMQRRGPR